MKILCVIPSRIGSTRLERKPLLSIQGIPMIQMVYENAVRCKLLSKVIVATDNTEIANIIKKCGGYAELTNSEFYTGSDRVAAIAEKHHDVDVIINLQGDEPFIKPKMLEQLISPYLTGENPEMATLAYNLSIRDYNDPETVKVITNLKGYALYFSRSPIPYLKNKTKTLPVYHHIGIYAFKREFLLQYTKLSQTPCELAESLEQLRALEHGYNIRVSLTEEKTLEINTLKDLMLAQNFKYNR
ncbi:MAG: 3-deoxy-manno-octulosonate cytidylyltransferase [Coxiellaceae bacterium]|jgi:3-deoxy-manno-octulosonate cytidylyltransferase (CMP-KDO synthetase)|nr:3-deoxy-manno-octulosonate cytidylyltransferase [Coxiellaceae bacterium]